MESKVENNEGLGVNIKTFVIFDTETTGLPSPGNKPKIIELCFIALTREELLTKQRASRVLSKLLICFNPCKKIGHISSKITGLHNDALEAMAPFRKQAPLISMFLRNLPQPVCLIAHNGNGFDFPLLVSHLRDANEEIPEDILCADSLEAVRMFDGLTPVPEFVLQKKRADIALAASLTAGIQNVKPLSTNSQAPGNVCEAYRIAQTVESNYQTGDVKSDQQDKEDNSDCQKRTADLFELVDHDRKCKQAKLSPQHTKVWNHYEFTPQMPLLVKTKSSEPRRMPSQSREDLFERRNEVRRMLFEGDDEISKEYKSQLHSALDKKFFISSKESPVCGPDKYVETESNDMFSVKNASVGYSADIEREMAQADTSTEICTGPSKKNDGAILSLNSAVSKSPGSDCIIASNLFCHEVMLKNAANSSASVEIDNNGLKESSLIACPMKERDVGKFPSKSKADKLSYALSSVYFRIFGQKPKGAHTAEGDCCTLLEIIRNKMDVFPTWCDKHAVPLTSISQMY